MKLHGKTITRGEANTLIREQLAGRWFWAWGKDPRSLPSLASDELYVPTRADWERLLRMSKADRLTRKPGTFNCVHFVAVLWGDLCRLSRKRWGPRAPFACGPMWSTHALLWILCIEDGEIRVKFVESQEDWILDPAPHPESGERIARQTHWGIWMMCGG